ncbi:hypothetical protein E1193_15005 [Micromonospora sp. KC606]|uniref:hypothetical protein n=1 Tax=Micromonospora sp. KC606 TaxID=2530379 RepID=UPI00104A28D6|nr:hypothetical protein [Micromonospora sp. KC606]TDC81343.1 hypothetical protein E1193_15005 [Micromonospora sp. KC606]
MKRITPLLTLLTGTGMAAVLFAMSAQAAPSTADPKAAAPAATAEAAPEGNATPEGNAAPAAPAEQSVPAQPSEQRSKPGTPTTSPPEAPAPQAGKKATTNWTGRLDGGRATIAITATGGEAAAYLCDGKQLEIWLRGTATDGRLSLTGKKDGATLTGTFDGRKAAGEVVVGGKRWSFTATIDTSARPVLFRATAGQRRAGVDGGWIMLPDGGQIGVVTRDGTPVTAPPLDPAFGTTIIDGVTVRAEPVSAEPGAGE